MKFGEFFQALFGAKPSKTEIKIRGLHPVKHSGSVCKRSKAKGTGASKTRNKRRYR